MLEHDGKRFAAYVDEKTGTPTWIIDVEALDSNLGVKPSLGSEMPVAAAARAFLAVHADVFGLYPGRLAPPRITTNGRLWFVSYQQAHRGLPVLNAEVGLTVTRNSM